MRGQLYRRHANATALSSGPVVDALGSESDDPGSSPGWGKAQCPWDVREKNASSAFKFGLIFILKVVLCFQGNFRLFQVNSSLPGDVAVDKFQFQN